MDNQPMTEGQFSFLVVLGSVVAFMVGNVLIGFANMGQASAIYGQIGGVLFLASIPMFFAGLMLCALSYVHKRRDLA